MCGDQVIELSLDRIYFWTFMNAAVKFEFNKYMSNYDICCLERCCKGNCHASLAYLVCASPVTFCIRLFCILNWA